MSEWSIFIDASGDFGPHDFRSPYCIITMVRDLKKNYLNPLAGFEWK